MVYNAHALSYTRTRTRTHTHTHTLIHTYTYTHTHTYYTHLQIMSGGGAMAIYHLGVVRTLMEHGTLPRVVAGSSGGSLIAAVVGCSTDKKLQSLMQPGQLMFTALALKPLRSLCKSLRNLEGVFDTNVLEEFVITHCGELTFKQAFECTYIRTRSTTGSYTDSSKNTYRHFYLHYIY